MNMMNKCAKFHKDSPSGKKVKFNLARAIELSETAVFVYNFVIETLCKRATLVAHLTNFSFEFLYEIFTEDASQLLLYHSAKKSKMTKNSNQGGSCLKEVNCSFGSGLGVRDRVGFIIVLWFSAIPIFGRVKRALQAALLSFAFSPRYGARSVLGASAPQGPRPVIS